MNLFLGACHQLSVGGSLRLGEIRVGVLDACTQEKRAGPPSDLDTSVVSGRSNASRHSVARLGGSLVHSTGAGVRDFFTPGSSL